MRYMVPDYYKRFECLAGACPLTCCEGWQIVIDDTSLEKYKRARGSFGNRLRNSVDFKERIFLQYDRRCAFLNEDNLCDMHIEAGRKWMCDTCRKYPKHIEEFDNEREITLSMSCPAAAELILGERKKAAWLTWEDEKEEDFDDDFDVFLYSMLQDTRGYMTELLQDRGISIYLRMGMVLALGHDVQNRINAGRIFEISDVLTRYQKEGAVERLLGKIKMEEKEGYGLLSLLEDLEVLDASWSEKCRQWRTQEDGDAYKGGMDETELEQMMIYYLITYFCGAVYDGDALAKVKMAIVSTLIWEEICLLQEQLDNRKLTFEERKLLAAAYSRELEHSDLNLNKMEELMNHAKEASFENLMKRLIYSFAFGKEM